MANFTSSESTRSTGMPHLAATRLVHSQPPVRLGVPEMIAEQRGAALLGALSQLSASEASNLRWRVHHGPACSCCGPEHALKFLVRAPCPKACDESKNASVQYTYYSRGLACDVHLQFIDILHENRHSGVLDAEVQSAEHYEIGSDDDVLVDSDMDEFDKFDVVAAGAEASEFVQWVTWAGAIVFSPPEDRARRIARNALTLVDVFYFRWTPPSTGKPRLPRGLAGGFACVWGNRLCYEDWVSDRFIGLPILLVSNSEDTEVAYICDAFYGSGGKTGRVYRVVVGDIWPPDPVSANLRQLSAEDIRSCFARGRPNGSLVDFNDPAAGSKVLIDAPCQRATIVASTSDWLITLGADGVFRHVPAEPCVGSSTCADID